MGFKKFTLGELTELDSGRVDVAWNKAVERVVRDCMDRPGDSSSRKVLLQLELTPVVSAEGDCEEVHGAFQIKDTVPTRKSKTYSFATNTKGDLIYSTNSPSNVRQSTFDDVDQVTGKVRMGPEDEDEEDEDDDGDEE